MGTDVKLTPVGGTPVLYTRPPITHLSNDTALPSLFLPSQTGGPDELGPGDGLRDVQLLDMLGLHSPSDPSSGPMCPDSALPSALFLRGDPPVEPRAPNGTAPLPPAATSTRRVDRKDGSVRTLWAATPTPAPAITGAAHRPARALNHTRGGASDHAHSPAPAGDPPASSSIDDRSLSLRSAATTASSDAAELAAPQGLPKPKRAFNTRPPGPPAAGAPTGAEHPAEHLDRKTAGPLCYALSPNSADFRGLNRSLSQICSSLLFPNGKVVESSQALCRFCGKRGHYRPHCPLDPSPPPRGLSGPFVERLLAWAATRPAVPALASLAEAKSFVVRTSDALDVGNPFAGDPRTSEFALRRRLAVWAAIGASRAVLSWLSYGYRLNFLADPPAVGFSNAPGAEQYGFFLDEEIPKRVSAGQFAVVPDGFARIINPLNVTTKASGGYRMILDARFPNAHLPDIYFRVENLSAVPTVVPRGSWLFTTDLADAYYHVPIHPDSRPFLCFRWRGTTYTTRVLPFGLGLAPWLFTRVTTPVIAFCRAINVRVIAYLDDFLWADQDPESVGELTEFVRWLFAALGFEVSEKKSHWTPAQCVLFLGLLLDTERYTFTVPPGRLEKVSALLRSILARVNRDSRVTVREIARICGHLLSMRLAVSPARIYTRALYAVLNEADSWNARADLSSEAVAELRFWADHLSHFNGRAVIRSASEHLLFCDASDYGWGAHVGADASVSAYGLFRDADQKTSSTFRELLGLLYALRSDPIATALSSCRVTFLLDSQAAVANLAKGGGPVPELSALVKDIWHVCLRHGIDAVPEWIRRDRNATADWLSRYRDTADWTLHSDAFAAVQRRWGPHTVDRFADRRNAKCRRYNSRYFDPDADGVDAFTQRWSGENNLCVPDPAWIDRTLAICEEQKAAMTLVFPEWPARPWFRRVKDAAREIVALGPCSRALLPGPNSSLHNPGHADWLIFAARLDFSAAAPAATSASVSGVSV